MEELKERLNATEEEIKKVLGMLRNEDGKKIIELHYGLKKDNLTLKEIADEMNTNMEAVRETEARALRALDTAIKELRKDKEYKDIL